MKGILFDVDITDKRGGTGLGLWIAKRIIEVHGGTIEYDPKYRKGAKFVITLPLQPVTDRPPRPVKRGEIAFISGTDDLPEGVKKDQLYELDSLYAKIQAQARAKDPVLTEELLFTIHKSQIESFIRMIQNYPKNGLSKKGINLLTQDWLSIVKIKEMSEFILKLQETTREARTMIRDGSRRGGLVYGYMNSIIQYTERMQENRIIPELLKINPIVKDTTDLLKVTSHQRRGPPNVMIDRIRIEEVVNNLTLNAKEQGLTYVEAHFSTQSVLLTVIDDGPPINEQTIFDYVHPSKAIGRQRNLWWIKKIIESHGGHMEARNTDDGVEFSFNIPTNNKPKPEINTEQSVETQLLDRMIDMDKASKLETIHVQLVSMQIKKYTEEGDTKPGLKPLAVSISLHESLIDENITYEVYKEKLIAMMKTLITEEPKYKDKANYVLELLSEVATDKVGGIDLNPKFIRWDIYRPVGDGLMFVQEIPPEYMDIEGLEPMITSIEVFQNENINIPITIDNIY